MSATTSTRTGALRQHAPDLWTVQMPFAKAGFEMGARMTLVRLPEDDLAGGGLLVHSPIELSPLLKNQVDELGEVRHIVTPTRHHHAHLWQWAQAFPNATVWGAPGLDSATAKTKLHDTLDHTPRGAWNRVLDQTTIDGNTLDSEIVFFHHPSRSLIVADLCFNISSRNASLMTKVAAKSLGVLDELSPSRAFKVATSDKEALRASIRRILDWDFDRIILSHGENVETNGKAKLRHAFAWLFA
jgi:glyoxylase-like metal-dependent hydrolase (beta-lactamase superfamily II)